MAISTQIQHVGIITNPTKSNADIVRKELSDWLGKRGLSVYDTTQLSIEKVIAESDVIVCLGGDGTILYLAGQMKDRTVPVVAVNIGSLGFLTEVRADELYEELKLIFAGQYEVEERILLCATVRWEGNKTEPERRFQALNDIVVNREGLSRYMTVQIDIGGEPAIKFSGDGVIIATPTGSTAYSLSAGGPIVYPTLDNVLITPICPHVSALRPVVLSGNQLIRIRITCDQAREKALLTADGQKDVTIDNRSIIDITKAENRFQLVKSSKRGYFTTLREKFKLPN